MSQPNRGWRTSTFVVATITGGGIGYVIARTSPVCRRPASGVRPLGTQCVSGERGTMAASPMARAVARQELFDARSHTAIAHLAEWGVVSADDRLLQPCRAGAIRLSAETLRRPI